MAIKKTIELNIIEVEPCKGDIIDWVTPFFTEDYISIKVEVITI